MMVRARVVTPEQLSAMLPGRVSPPRRPSASVLVAIAAQAVWGGDLWLHLPEDRGAHGAGEGTDGSLEMLHVPPPEVAPPEGIEVLDDLVDDDEPHLQASSEIVDEGDESHIETETEVDDDDEPHVEAETDLDDEDEPHIETGTDLNDEDEPHIETGTDLDDEDEPHIETGTEVSDESEAA